MGPLTLSSLGGLGRRAGELTAGGRDTALAGAELLGLSALALAQPILDALERSTFAFPTVGVGGFDLVILTAALVLVPPAAMLAVEMIAGLISRSARGWVHLGWIGLLVALLCWQAVWHAGDSAFLIRVVIPAAGFFAAVALYVRFEAARTLCRVLAFAAPIVAGLFLFTAPIRSFTFAADPDIPQPKVESETPVVLIVLDELPLAALLDSEGRIDAKRFPNFAALARESDWFRRAVTVADSTEQAVPAILSGDFPEPNGVAVYTDHPENLYTLLGSSYPTNISESGTYLCPPSLCARRSSLAERLRLVLATGLSTAAGSFPFGLADDVARKLNIRDAFGTPPEQVGRFLTGIRSPAGGSLNAIHVELPHVPWRYLPSGRLYLSDTLPLGITTEFWSESPGYAIQGLQRLMLQLQYTDQVLGQMLARLRRAGLYQRGLVVVVADHGAAFMPYESRRIVSPANAGWVLRVPLFVKLPGQRRGRVISRPVRTIDLLPTIADVLGIRIPWQVDGRSLLGSPSKRRLNSYMKYREDLVQIPLAEVSRGFSSALAVRNGLVGSGDIFTLGASHDELRRKLRGARPLRVAVESPGGTTFFPQSGLYPSLVYGSLLDPGVEDGERLIARINGRIVAVGHAVDGGTRFTVLIPPSAFRPGENELELLAPAGEGSG